MDTILRALNRFGLGARIGERETIGDPRSWLLAQLDARPGSTVTPDLTTLAEAGEALQELRRAQREDPQRAREARAAFQGIRRAEISFALGERVATETRFVATKLVRHFVADVPPPAAIDRVEEVFVRSGGNLKQVAAALVELEEAWEPTMQKLRTPQEWLTAVLRATGVRAPQVAQVLEPLRHPFWAPPSPKGYGDTVRDWTDPDGLMNRAELSRTLVRRLGRAGLDPAGFLDVVDVPPDDPLRSTLTDSSIPADERIALAIAGPAFHWR